MRDRGARPLNIAACARKLDVDDRLALRLYYRAAGNLLKQASVYRDEGNIIELYVLLLRFSSLVSETVPQHRDYRNSFSSEKSLFRKKLSEVLEELEALKPDVQKLVDQINRERLALIKYEDASTSIEPSCVSKSQSLLKFVTYQGDFGFSVDAIPRADNSVTSHRETSWSLSHQSENQLHSWPRSLITPTTDSLSRHSYFGPSLSKGREFNSLPSMARYPVLITPAPVESLSLERQLESVQIANEVTTPLLNPVNYSDQGIEVPKVEDSTALVGSTPANIQLDLLRELCPPPIAVPVENVPVEPDNIASDSLSRLVAPDQQPGTVNSSEDILEHSKEPKSMHISIRMMEEFLAIAKSNTQKSIETCGVLSGHFKKGIFHVSTLIVPKQKATSNTCEAINEEEIFFTQDKRGLFQLGWIHTHPSQSCFMSSVDLHTHYSYQVMLQEAIAIVMAPADAKRKFGIFRLSDPGGMTIIKQCERRGFHSHGNPADGGPVYQVCDHVVMDPALKFEVIDLRL